MHASDTHESRVALRFGAVASIGGVIAALVQSAIDPVLPDDPAAAIHQASLSHHLSASRLLDAAAFLLMLAGVAVAARFVPQGRGGVWARLALVFYSISAGAGAIATMVVGSFPDIGRAWAEAPAELQPGYVAAMDSLVHISGGIFSVSWLTLGAFGLAFAAAIAKSRHFPRALVWISAAGGVALIGAIASGVLLQAPFAFVLLLLGLLLSYVVIATLGVSMWRHASAADGVAEAEPSGHALHR